MQKIFVCYPAGDGAVSSGTIERLKTQLEKNGFALSEKETCTVAVAVCGSRDPALKEMVVSLLERGIPVLATSHVSSAHVPYVQSIRDIRHPLLRFEEYEQHIAEVPQKLHAFITMVTASPAFGRSKQPSPPR